jgi:hypothetical protein
LLQFSKRKKKVYKEKRKSTYLYLVLNIFFVRTLDLIFPQNLRKFPHKWFEFNKEDFGDMKRA